MKNVILILSILALGACSFFKKKKDADKDVIARVNDEYLYASDLQNLTRGLKGADSVAVLRGYAETWVRKKLLLVKAQENIPDDDVSINKKIEDYRETLTLYEYEKELINQKLDTAVKDQELEQWYDKMKNDFLLEDDVYQVYYVKLKKDAPQLNDVRKWILRPANEEDTRKLEGYCKEYAISYLLDKGIWLNSADLLKTFSLSNFEMGQLGSNFKEFSRNDELWFIKAPEVKHKGEPAPVWFVREELVKLIVEKRKMDLLERTYTRIYQDGVKEKTFEILVK